MVTRKKLEKRTVDSQQSEKRRRLLNKRCTVDSTRSEKRA
jgi:hypothetical protein